MKFKYLAFSLALATCLSITALSSIAAEPYVRPQPTEPVKAANMILGSAHPVIAVPLVAQTRDAILKEAAVVKALKPDLIEIRADYWDFIEDTDKSVVMLQDIKNVMGEIPILLTVRIKEERGFKDVSKEAKFAFYDRAIIEKNSNTYRCRACLWKRFY